MYTALQSWELGHSAHPGGEGAVRVNKEGYAEIERLRVEHNGCEPLTIDVPPKGRRPGT